MGQPSLSHGEQLVTFSSNVTRVLVAGEWIQFGNFEKQTRFSPGTGAESLPEKARSCRSSSASGKKAPSSKALSPRGRSGMLNQAEADLPR
jgi:hypothetical protein